MSAALLALLLLPAAPARAAQALVVVSEPLSPSSLEALDGLRAEWGGPVETASAGSALPPGPHGVIIALGGRAARRARGADAPSVIALAPAYRPDARRPGSVVVAMTPSPERFMSFLVAAGVRRLLAVRGEPADSDFLRRAADAGRPHGIGVEEHILSSPEGLAHLLRTAGTRADGIWLAPDPAVVTPENFATAREFARARGLPFFAPAAGLVTDEIRGELTVSFRDCGREAARAAQEILAGRPVAKIVYPSAFETLARTAVSTATR